MNDVAVPVRSVSTVGPTSVAVAFETPAGFDAFPGQFVQVSARIDGELVQRFFTLSSKDVEETVEITVGVDPSGTLSPWLADREPGDTVRISGPFGEVYYEGDSPAVVLGAGPGIGPAVGIGERALEEDEPIGIVHPEETDVHRDRLDALEKRGAFIYTVEDDLETAIQSAMDEVDGALYVYGFSPFVTKAVRGIEAAGYDSDAANIESFGPGP
ncbi:MAG: FAD-dependent oxidoreductase [Halodesulfurarchaeum sp.]